MPLPSSKKIPEKIVVRKMRVVREGRHAAVWKIAYADFVTALMAFFLLLWLLSSVETSSLTGVGNIFDPKSPTTETTGAAGGLFGGIGLQQEHPLNLDSAPIFEEIDAKSNTRFPYASDYTGVADEISTGAQGTVDYDVVVDGSNESMQKLRNQLASLPRVSDQNLEETVNFNVAPRGIHLELVVPSQEAMFELGSARLTSRTKVLLRSIANLLLPLSSRVSIGGYSDSSGSDEVNWNLSMQRALVAKDYLIQSGLPESRIELVEAYGDRRPLFDYDPTSEGNRRLTVTLLDDDYVRLWDVLTRSSIPPRLLQ